MSLAAVDKSDSVLTVENFTFFKEPIGMDQQQEILRYAKQRRVSGSSFSFSARRTAAAVFLCLSRNLRRLLWVFVIGFGGAAG